MKNILKIILATNCVVLACGFFVLLSAQPSNAFELTDEEVEKLVLPPLQKVEVWDSNELYRKEACERLANQALASCRHRNQGQIGDSCWSDFRRDMKICSGILKTKRVMESRYPAEWLRKRMR